MCAKKVTLKVVEHKVQECCHERCQASFQTTLIPVMKKRIILQTQLMLLCLQVVEPFVGGVHCTLAGSAHPTTALYGWFDNFWQTDASGSTSRQMEYPEQYPATYEANDVILEQDKGDERIRLIRPLLKNTQLESRPLELAYQSSRDGWNASAFHSAVDGKGAAVVVATTSEDRIVGGYNPKGWASLGGARPSVAAFLFYYFKKTTTVSDQTSWQKLRKVGGGGLACANDDPGFGISFGPDGLVIPLANDDNDNKFAYSKLGPYFERGPEDLPSLFSNGRAELLDVQVFVGVYNAGEEIPYAGGVLDMTSG
eukprot:scaffold22742_cov139-Cylindrotheca_fusiformis.AAC.3